MNTAQKEDFPEVTVDGLAVMTAKGFNEVHAKMDRGFERMDNEFIKVRQEMKEGFTDVRTEMREGFSGIRQSIALVLENMATKTDIARIETRITDVERIVYKDQGLRLRRIEHKLKIV